MWLGRRTTPEAFGRERSNIASGMFAGGLDNRRVGDTVVGCGPPGGNHSSSAMVGGDGEAIAPEYSPETTEASWLGQLEGARREE